MKDAKWQRRIEMTAFGLGLSVIIGLLVGLIVLERPGQPTVELLSAAITGVERKGDHMIVRFELRNRGTAAAERVIVRIDAPGGPPPLDQVVNYLPVGMGRRGVATLYDVPANASPSARIIGYLLP